MEVWLKDAFPFQKGVMFKGSTLIFGKVFLFKQTNHSNHPIKKKSYIPEDCNTSDDHDFYHHLLPDGHGDSKAAIKKKPLGIDVFFYVHGTCATYRFKDTNCDWLYVGL